MLETAVYFGINHNCTVNQRGAKTVFVHRDSTAYKRCIVCVTVAADGKKLPLFDIFKGTVKGRIPKELHSIMLDGMYVCTEEKGWMDN